MTILAGLIDARWCSGLDLEIYQHFVAQLDKPSLTDPYLNLGLIDRSVVKTLAAIDFMDDDPFDTLIGDWRISEAGLWEPHSGKTGYAIIYMGNNDHILVVRSRHTARGSPSKFSGVGDPRLPGTTLVYSLAPTLMTERRFIEKASEDELAGLDYANKELL
jgi:hypothetical protein